MTRFLYTLILFAFVGLHVAPAHARAPRPYTPPEKFTADEKAFLISIAKKAATTVQSSLKSANYQADCIERYINKSTPCADSTQIIQAVKAAYSQYRTYFIMSDYGYFLSRVRGRAAMVAGNRPIPMSTDYSENTLWIVPNERDRMMQLRKDDETFINNTKDECTVNMDLLKEHYQRQLSQIVSLVPVVLMISTKETMPSDQEVLEGYKELVRQIQSTLSTFTDYDKNDLEGLWAYQMLAQSIAEQSPANKAIFKSLTIKIDPQGILEHIGAWISKTFFSYNILFIGCTVVAIVTVNPVIAMACAFANTLLSAYTVYNNLLEVDNKRAEWLAGVNTFEAIATAKMQLAVDSVLMFLNVGATAVVVKSVFSTPAVLSKEFHKELIRTNLSNDVLKQKANTYVKDLLTDQSKGEAKNFVGTMIIGNTQHFLSGEEVDRISQASSEMIVQFRRKGLFTYKDTATAMCSVAKNN